MGYAEDISIAYIARREAPLYAALQEQHCHLFPTAPEGQPLPDTHPTTVGLGYYQNGEPLHIKQPCEGKGTTSFRGLVDAVRTDCALAHVRHSESFQASDLPPFRFREWLFTYNGPPQLLSAFDERFRSLPDFLRRNIHGGSSAEVIFHVLLHQLHKLGAIVSVNVTPQILQQMSLTCHTLLQRDSQPRARWSIWLADGTRHYVLTHGMKLRISRSDATSKPLQPTTYSDYASLSYAMISSLSDSAVSAQPQKGVSLSQEIVEEGLYCIDHHLEWQRV